MSGFADLGFHRAAYKLILGREAGEEEIAARRDADISALFAELLFSEEFATSRLYDFREMLLTRFTEHFAPGFDRYRAAVARFRAGETLFAASPEDAEFLTVAYLAILRRLPDPIGFCAGMHALQRGRHDRSGIVEDLLASPEAWSRGGAARFFGTGGMPSSVESFDLPDPDRMTAATPLDPADAEEPGPTPLIVTGPPRSGTTVLGAMLNAHPRICVTYESRVFSLPEQLRRSLFTISPSRAGVFDEIFDLACGHAPAVIRRSLGSLRKYVLVVDHARRSVRRRLREDRPPLFVGDKNPAYLAEAAWTPMQTIRAFPDAKWIMIFRDPEAVCRSQLRLGMAPSRDAVCDRLLQALRNAVEVRRILGDAQSLVVTHDRLFGHESTAAEVARIATFLGLESDSYFATFAGRQRRDPERFSRGETAGSRPVAREAVARFFADRPDAISFMEHIDGLGLWH